MDLTLCLTHACNLRCTYCYAGPKFSRSMTWETVCKALDFAFSQTLDEATRHNREPECRLGFFGGEPLLEWDLLCRATGHAASLAARMGIRLTNTVTTNLTLLTESKADWLRARNFHVGLSIDGNAAMHDTLRRTSGGAPSHADCARALAFFTGRNSNGEVIVVLDPLNIEHLAESIRWLADVGIRSISLNPNFSAAWSQEALAAWSDAYEQLGGEFAESFRRDDPLRINVIDGKIRSRINGGYRPCDRCGFGESEIAISAAGNFYPCERLVGDDTNRDLRIGDVHGGFHALKRNQILTSRHNDVAECLGCPVRGRCFNGCGCVNHASTGFINRVSGLVCHHEKLSIRVADKAASTLFAERNPAFINRFYGHLLEGVPG